LSVDRHLTWENFARDILAANVPATHPVPGTPEVSLFHLVVPKRIGLYISLAVPFALPPSEYQEIETAVQAAARGPVLAVWTTNEALFRPFFSLLLEIADAVQLEGVPPREAVRLAIQRFSSVIEKDASLSLEKVIGLWGELEVLARILSRKGSSSLDCWQGWRADRHDFRLPKLELEVKSTLAADPIHVIHGLHQLHASSGHTLYLLSMQLIRSGSGSTLDDQIRRVKELLVSDTAAVSRFEEAIKSISKNNGLSASKLGAGSGRLMLRCAPRLIALDETVPTLTSNNLGTLISPLALARLVEVHYRINCAGLGHDTESDFFHNVLPWMTANDG